MNILDHAFEVIVLAAATTIAGSVTSWLQLRSQSGRLGRSLDQSAKLLQFFDTWLQLRAKTAAMPEDENKQKAQELIQSVLTEISASFDSDRNVVACGSSEVGVLRKVFLFYAPRTEFGWVLRLLFYVFLILFLMTVRGFAMLPKPSLGNFEVVLILLALVILAQRIASWKVF